MRKSSKKHGYATAPYIRRRRPVAINRSDIKRIEKLAKLKLSEEKIDDFSVRISRVFDWVDQLKEVDVEGVDPMASPLMDLQKHTTGLREDTVTDGDRVHDVIQNAPSSQHNSFVVPKVVE